MSGYFGYSVVPIGLSTWLRSWLTRRLHRKKIFVVNGRAFLTQPLTLREEATIFVIHLVILGASAAATVLLFIGATNLIYD
jgi:hypothetical protein